MNFKPCHGKFYWITFKKNCLSRELFTTGGKRKLSVLEVFRAYLKDFSIFFREIYMVARSFYILAEDIKSLFVSTLVSLETRLKVPISAIL